MANKFNEEEERCSFCGRTVHEDEKDIVLIKGPDNIYICSSCAQTCVEMAQEELEENEIEDELDIKDIKPSQLKAYLDKYVIDQEYAKETLATAVYNHYKMLKYKNKNKQDVELDKSNILLVGPTGSGKTYLLKTLSKFLDVPLAISDATSLTAAGYVGEDVENVLLKLIQAADYDIEKAQRGIVYIDEIDKLSRKGDNPSITRDVSGEDVQQAILKMVEGSIIDVPPKGGRKHPNQECIQIDTTNILFIIGGSFEGIEKIIAKRTKDGSGIGFGGKVESKVKVEINDHIKNVDIDDFKKFGMIPELLGRFHVICPLEELSLEAMTSILTEPKNALVKQYQELFKMDNIKLTFEKPALEAIAKMAMKRKTGARALRGIIENVLHSHMYSFPDDESIKEVIVTEKVVTEKEAPIIKRKRIKAS